MNKAQKTKLLKWVLTISVSLAMILFSFISFKKNQISQEISKVEEKIADDTISEYFIQNLKTEAGKKFGEEAFEEYEIMVENFPTPKIIVLDEYEIVVEEYGTGKDAFTITDWIISTNSSDETFEIKVKVEDADHVFISDDLYYKEKDEVDLNKNGNYSKEVILEDLKTSIYVSAENKYKKSWINLKVLRLENEKEMEQRVAEENQQRQWEEEAAAEEQEWQNSRGGQLCKQYPDWTKTECANVADNLIWVGMTYEMLIVERGAPNVITPSNYGYGTQWQWCWWNYTPNCFYDDNDDGLIDAYN